MWFSAPGIQHLFFIYSYLQYPMWTTSPHRLIDYTWDDHDDHDDNVNHGLRPYYVMILGMLMMAISLHLGYDPKQDEDYDEYSCHDYHDYPGSYQEWRWWPSSSPGP